jgi:hypothetical protein
MVTQMYRLVKATAAVLQNAGQQAFEVLPEGSVVQVESSADAGQTVNIRWQDRELWMFASDLRGRGILLSPRPQGTTETLESPTPLRAGAE